MTVNPETTDAIPRNGIRASLTSLQKRIISQLKDRPPRYETRHNYEYRQRETPEVRVTSASLPVPNEPPPNYDGTIVSFFFKYILLIFSYIKINIIPGCQRRTSTLLQLFCHSGIHRN